VVSFTPLPLYTGVQSSEYPLDRMLGEPQSWSGRCGEEKSLLFLQGIKPRTSPTKLKTCTIINSHTTRVENWQITTVQYGLLPLNVELF
jgi:hypothetical protein